MEQSLQLPDFIDYSQYSAWLKCPWIWYERQINKRRKAWPSALRTDALCIGSLVHAGLETWHQDHRPDIPESAISEHTPSPETLTLCRLMVVGYARAYPAEQWPKVACEQPLRFGLLAGCDGLAKIDTWFEVPEQTTIESGIPGYECSLSPGYWIHENKTKAESISMGHFMQKWEVNMQASFQMLALQAHLGKPVAGVLVNVIEKPKIYIPRRKCKSCDQLWELSSWLPGTGPESVCPNCGASQRLAKGNTETTIGTPGYYRFVVRRTAEQLEIAHSQIVSVAESMQQAASIGMESTIPNTEACVDPSHRYVCDYFDPHTYGGSTLNNPQFINIADYVNERVPTVL